MKTKRQILISGIVPLTLTIALIVIYLNIANVYCYYSLKYGDENRKISALASLVMRNSEVPGYILKQVTLCEQSDSQAVRAGCESVIKRQHQMQIKITNDE